MPFIFGLSSNSLATGSSSSSSMAASRSGGRRQNLRSAGSFFSGAMRLVALGLLGSAAAAATEVLPPTTTIRGTIRIPTHFRVVKELFTACKLVLSNNVDTRVVFPNSRGHFEIPDVMTGDTYSLDLFHPVLWFDPVLVEVGRKADGIEDDAKVTPYLSDVLYGRGAKLRYPLELAPSTVKMYFEEREDFNILSLFKSPMVLMMAVMFGFVYLMPKMMPTLDEEEKKDLRKQMKNEKGASATLLKNFIGEE